MGALRCAPSTAVGIREPGREVTLRWPYGTANRQLRASDKDREAVITLLNEHTAAGRLTLEEFEQRVSAAYDAKLVADLDGLLADLPAVRPVVSPQAQRVFTLAVWGPWLLTATICFTIWAMTSIGSGRALYFWPFWVIVPWGLVLLAGTITGRAVVGGRSRRILSQS